METFYSWQDVKITQVFSSIPKSNPEYAKRGRDVRLIGLGKQCHKFEKLLKERWMDFDVGENGGSEMRAMCNQGIGWGKSFHCSLFSLQPCPTRIVAHSITTAKPTLSSSIPGLPSWRQHASASSGAWGGEPMVAGRWAKTLLSSPSLVPKLVYYNHGKDLLDKSSTKGDGTGSFTEGQD